MGLEDLQPGQAAFEGLVCSLIRKLAASRLRQRHTRVELHADTKNKTGCFKKSELPTRRYSQ